MTPRFSRHTASGTRILCGPHSTFTFNLEVYCLTALAVSDFLGCTPKPAPDRWQWRDREEYRPDDSDAVVRDAAGGRVAIGKRSSIDVAIVADTTHTG
jgi:hypothetical protein